MKKLCIFLTIALTFSIFAIFTPTVSRAEGYTVGITATAQHQSDTGNTNLPIDQNRLEVDYSLYKTINLEASLNGYNGEGVLTYVWKDTTNNANLVVATQANLTLDKVLDQDLANLMRMGIKTYQVTISNEAENINISQTITLEITSQNGKIILIESPKNLTTNSSGQYVINNNTNNILISSKMATTNDSAIPVWYYKTPNSSTYNFFSEGSNCTIIPKDLISSKNGYGVYKFFACCQINNNVYTSDTLEFVCNAGSAVDTEGHYSITSDIVPNSKAQVEAYAYTLKNAANDHLDFNKIIWFVEGEKVGAGETFTYEPTSNKEYSVSVKYQTADGFQTLAVTTTKPASTGTVYLIIYILAGALVLFVIFIINVKRLNKKRDVVW